MFGQEDELYAALCEQQEIVKKLKNFILEDIRDCIGEVLWRHLKEYEAEKFEELKLVDDDG